MGSRHALEVYDASLARQQQILAEPHKYAHRPTGEAPRLPPLSQETQQKLLAALAKESQKAREREEERRKRDPTYRPDAIELSDANLLPFDKYVDYYERLNVDQFASALEIKQAYKKLSLELHPDKMTDKSEAERAIAKERFILMTEANNILADLATRRAYDKQRDNLDANNEAGLADIGKMEKPPPTCVDVEVTLQQLYRGARKTVAFTRNEFAGTKYHKTSRDNFVVKVNRGELEGATIWHRNLGDSGPRGRSDLVLVVKQAPHDVYERLGDDLWYYDREAHVPAERIFYCAWAPTMASTKYADAKHSLHSTFERVAACGSTLAALLGCDRSGLGEALVPGHGMPLNPHSASDEELTQGGKRTHGDLVVKFPIALPARQRRIVLAQGDGTLPMPPIALLTSRDDGTLNVSAASVLIQHYILPNVLLRVGRRRLLRVERAAAAPPSHPPPLPGDAPIPHVSPSAMPPPFADPLDTTPEGTLRLVGVCLLVGGADGLEATPSDATAALMALLSSALPQLAWQVVHMASGVAEPLLADERGELASMVASWAEEEEWVVSREPGMRIRTSASTSSTAIGVLRAGQAVRGRLVAHGNAAWIQLHGSMSKYVLCVSADGDVYARPWGQQQPGGEAGGRGGSTLGAEVDVSDDVSDGTAGRPAAATAAAAANAAVVREGADESADLKRAVSEREKQEQAALQAEIEEDAAWVADGRPGGGALLDAQYLSNGCTVAMALMGHASANAIARCHCEGGVVLAVDRGCALLGLSCPNAYRAAARPNADNGPPRGLALPFLLSAAHAPTSASDADGWRKLRAATLRSAVDECMHGYSAIGVPRGGVLCVLPSRGFAVRSVLGSSQPQKISLRKVREVDERRSVRVAQAKVRRERERVLSEIRAQLAMYGVEAVVAHQRDVKSAGTDGGDRHLQEDFLGARRGGCTRCDECTCFVRVTRLPHASSLHHYCGRCGCESHHHEEIKKGQPRGR